MITKLNKPNFLFATFILFLIVSVVAGVTFFSPNTTAKHTALKGEVEYNKEIALETENGIKDLLSEGRYKCCLLKPCTYCFSNPEHQDRELVCDCLEDIMNGKHPCGECIGEILEGNGNSLIAEYFATAIAEEVGEQHLDTLKKIIAEKYEMPISQQL